MVNVLITGAHGLLGQSLAAKCSGKYSLIISDKDDRSLFETFDYQYYNLDITNRKLLKKVISEVKPGYIINTAAFSNVDGCEVNKELCWKANVEGTGNLAEICNKIGAHLIHLSTDYVFDGGKGNYTEDDIPNPINYYGKSKLASENEIKISSCQSTILRTASLYGFDTIRKQNNFVSWVVNNLKSGSPMKIADDQIANPTYVPNLADAIWKIIRLEKTGIYHFTGSESINRYNFAKKIARQFSLGFDQVSTIKMSEIEGRKADRPQDSSLNISKFREEIGMEIYSVERGMRSLFQRYGHYLGYAVTIAGN